MKQFYIILLILLGVLLTNACKYSSDNNSQNDNHTMKRIINTDKAPKAIGPYSQAIEANGFLFISGQIPVDPATGTVVEGGIREQTQQVLENIKSILDEAGYSLSDVVKSTCFLKDINDFQGMNELYGKYYSDHKPTRSTFAVKDLPLGVLVEIETIAAR